MLSKEGLAVTLEWGMVVRVWVSCGVAVGNEEGNLAERLRKMMMWLRR